MKRRLLKLALLAAALGAAGFIVAASGLIPVKASSGHWPITEWFLRFAMRRSVATHSLAVKVPPLDDPALIVKGATHFEIGCRSCHGSPGEPLPRIAQAMLPPPPKLVPRIQASNPRRLFHVVKHGLKFTGMPAWPAPHRDDEVWAVVAFLLKLPELDRAAYRRLVHGDGAPASATPFAPVEPVPAVPTSVLQTCASCHGRDGLGRDSPAFPKLAGQREEYLRNALSAYARGMRHSGIMGPVTANLDDAILRELAAHYARLPRAPAAVGTPSDAAAIARGRTIAHEGIRDRRVPACVECHGPTGRRHKPAYPLLAGQPADYLVLQLELFQQGRRGGSGYAHLMEPVAARLEPAQMRDVAKYFESLPDRE